MSGANSPGSSSTSPRWPSTNARGAAQRREAEAQQPFDLERPLLRVSLVRLDEQEHQLWVTLHHIVADGWSLNLLLDEFSRLYAEACGGQPADLAPLELHYAEFAAWQRQWLDAGEGARQLAYWRERLGDAAPVLELATDHPRTARQASPAARYSLRVDALARAIREAALDHEASVFMWLLAAFQALLHRHSGQGEIRIGVPSANRQRLETQGLVGFFINTLVLRGTPRARQPFAALLGEAREATLGAQANQDRRSTRCSRPAARAASCSRCCSTTSSATCRRCAGCPACSPTSCPGTAAKPSSTCNCRARRTLAVA